MKKSANINKNKWNIYPILSLAIIVLMWGMITSLEFLPKYMLPSPGSVIFAVYEDFDILLEHSVYTLGEAFLGLSFGILLGFLIATLMDRFQFVHKLVYPLLIVTQTIPPVAIAPLLVLWFGYDMLPKVVLIVLVTFFPIAIGLLEGYSSTDRDLIGLMRAMGANDFQIFRHVKFHGALSHFFSGLKISSAYAIVGAVISEWLGGFYGLGVYMIRVKNSFAFDKMFGVIIIISIISLLLMKFVDILRDKVFSWEE